jgi:hypothetical protein
LSKGINFVFKKKKVGRWGHDVSQQCNRVARWGGRVVWKLRLEKKMVKRKGQKLTSKKD